ncbi:glycosyltransferase [Bacillus solitudinis]|uniref:glycosyltransferase n=1 Tax=Bacillus solitudinis TaxID=2014074 RepID=UPI001D0D1275|nr:glycosyltransferase [Bacillus solitudinis]
MSKKLRILVLSNMYPGPRQATFGIFVKNQVEALRETGVEVDVVAVSDPSMVRQRVIKKYLTWMLQTGVTFLRKGRSYDVVHAHYVFPTGMLALFFKKFLNTKLIVTAHGGDIDRMAKKNARIQAWTKQILTEADHVIAVGKELYETIHTEYNVEKERMSLLNMGVNRTVFQPIKKAEAFAALELKEGTRPLLFIGNFIPEKGVLELLEAYRLLKEKDPALTLHLVGNPKKDEFLEQMKSLITKHDMKEVFIYPAVPQAELAIWMSAAEVFVLPSHLEGFGLVALEAMSCGTPVVGTKVGGLQYLLGDGHGVLVEPKNTASLQHGIEEVLYQPELATTLKEKGFARADEHDQERILKKLLLLYGEKEG